MNITRFFAVAFIVLLNLETTNGQGPVSDAEQKLRQAFGANSDLVRDAKIKFELSMDEGKTVYVFACREFKVLENGKVKLTPGHYACYVREEGKKTYRASSTGTSSQAELSFDRAVKTIEEMQKAHLKSISWPGVVTQGVQKQ